MLVEEHTIGELKMSGTQFEIVLEKRILITELKLCQGPVFHRLNENNWQRESGCLILYLQSTSIAHVREFHQKKNQPNLLLTDFNAFHVLSNFQLAQIKDVNYETTLQKSEYWSVFWGGYTI